MSSTSLAFEFASTTFTTPFPTASGPAWINGQFPSSLTITNNRLTECLIADVPFYTVGVLAIGVATFISVMNRMQRHVFEILFGVFLAFVAAIVDLAQLIIINRTRNIFAAGVFPMRIARELGYAVSFGMRFFSFWRLVAMPPRGEIPVLPTPGRANNTSLAMDDDFHSGSWGRWGVTGVLAKYILLVGTIAIGVTQAIWRLGFTFGFTKFTTVYQADAIMEIVLSGCFLLKLAGNVYLSPLTPRWRTVRDYLPVVATISIGLGIAVGNLLCMRFSESPLGRFLQAIELYILILYVLIATFYNMPVRASMIADALDRERTRANSSFVGINMSDSMRGSTFRVTPPNISTPSLPMAREPEAAGTNGVSTRLLRPDQPRRLSATERFTNWIQSRLSGRPSDRELDPQAYSNLVGPKDVENGQIETFDYTDKQRQFPDSLSETSVGPPKPEYGKPESMYAGVQTPPTGTSTAVNDTPLFPREGRTLPVTAAYAPATSYAPAESEPAGPSSQRGAPSTLMSAYSPMISEAFSPIIAAALAPTTPLNVRTLSSQSRPRNPEPAAVPTPATMPVPVVARVATPPPVLANPDSPSGTSFRITREYGYDLSLRPASSRSLRVPGRTPNLGEESPIYGLEGIIASLGGDLLPDEEIPSQRADSAIYSPGVASFQRRQAELDHSVANLRSFSPEGTVRQPLYGLNDNTNPSVLSLERGSASYKSDFSLSNFPSPPAAKLSFPGPSRRVSVAARPGEVDLDDLRFTLGPPRMPATTPDGRQVSFPSTTRGSDILQDQPRAAANSNGTQWDVTSFIGGPETRTALAAAIARPDSQGRPLSYARNQLIQRDTTDSQRLSMVIEALSNIAETPDLPDEDSSVQDARIVDLRRTPSLSRARIVDGPLSAAASSINSVSPQPEPIPLPTPAERLAAFRARPTFKSALPSSPRPAYRADSPNSLGRSAPLGLDLGPPSASSILQPQPLISNLQVQASGQQPTQIPGFAPQPRPFASNVLTPPRGGLRNLRIGGPVEQSQGKSVLDDSAFERPRPAPLVLAGTARVASPPGRAI